MLNRYGFGFYEVVTRIARLRYQAYIRASSTSSSRWKADEYTVGEVTASLTAMRAECDKLDLTSTADLVLHIQSEVSRTDKEYSNGDLRNHLDTLDASFANELRRKSCFLIAQEKDKYFQKDDLFGPEVSGAFGACIGEIRDAGNCYALEQDEAAVFHLMRILERGLDALATRFGVDFSHTNWHNVIEQVEKHIRNMGPSFGSDWKEQQRFYSQVAIHFMFLKEAWRNHVMHVRDVPYDEGRALSVFGHVREFMQALTKGGLTE